MFTTAHPDTCNIATRYIVHAAEISGNKQVTTVKLTALNSCNKIIVPAERSLTDFVFQYVLQALHHEDTRSSAMKKSNSLTRQRGACHDSAAWAQMHNVVWE